MRTNFGIQLMLHSSDQVTMFVCVLPYTVSGQLILMKQITLQSGLEYMLIYKLVDGYCHQYDI